MRCFVALLLAPVLSAPHATRRISRASTVIPNHALRSASVARARLRDKVVAAEGPAALAACGTFLPAARRLARERRNRDTVDLAFRVAPNTQSSSFSPIAQNARTARGFKGRTRVDRSRAVVQPGRSPRRKVSAVVGKVGARRGTPTRPGARGPNDDRRLPERGFPPGRPRRGRAAKAGRR